MTVLWGEWTGGGSAEQAVPNPGHESVSEISDRSGNDPQRGCYRRPHPGKATQDPNHRGASHEVTLVVEEMNGPSVLWDIIPGKATLPGVPSDGCELQSFPVVSTSGKPDKSAAESTFAIKEEKL